MNLVKAFTRSLWPILSTSCSWIKNYELFICATLCPLTASAATFSKRDRLLSFLPGRSKEQARKLAICWQLRRSVGHDLQQPNESYPRSALSSPLHRLQETRRMALPRLCFALPSRRATYLPYLWPSYSRNSPMFFLLHVPTTHRRHSCSFLFHRSTARIYSQVQV